MTPLADTGRVIAGRYRLEAPIGRGAMGIVWRARDQLLDRDVAVKEVQLADTLSADERANAYQRTLREAKTAARLSHPGVVSVYDVADDDGRPWIVMELVNARSLDQVLAVEGPLSPRQTAEIGRQLLSALSVAHSAGVLHRDVKPSNVLLSQEGRAVLTDFGIATFQGDPKLTQTGMVMGSPGFTAPERIRGGDATPASDLWSLGATLYAAVEGHGPYESRGGAITTMSAIINEDAPAAPAAGALSRVIEALLRREPTDRPDAATASRMISDIMPMLPDRPAADGYQPTSLSAAPGGSYGGGAAAGGSYGGASPAAQTSMDAASQEPAAIKEPPGPDPYGAPSTWAAPAASIAPPTMPQPSLNDTPGPASGLSGSSGLGGSRGIGSQEPDFSSWYSSPRPSPSGAADRAPGYAAQPSSYGPQASSYAAQPSSYGAQPSSYGAQPPQRDVASWPEAPPSSSGPNRPPRSGGTGRRWLLALIALAVIGAGAGAATVMLLRHSGTSNNPGASSTTQGTGTSATNTPQGTASTPAPASGAFSRLNIPQAINDPSSGPFPAGFTDYKLPASSAGTTAGFSLSYPSSWSVRRSGYQTYFQDPSLNAYVLVDLTPHTYPNDMLREARFIKVRSASAHPGYVGAIAVLTIRGAAGSEWRFTYTDGGTQEVLDMLWVASTGAGNQSYAMYFTAPKGSWGQLRPVFSTIAQSFDPLAS
jgi:serine/threonine protein kinase